MALTFNNSNWDAILQQDLIIPDSTLYPSAQDEAAAWLFDDIMSPPELYCDDFFNLPADPYFNVDSFFEPHPENTLPLLPPPGCIFAPELDSFHSAKRQKLVVDDVPANGNSGGRSLSPQSVAARQRRRKISEKTHELGKLVPGGTKMNTAEMFGAAYKYIQYLQAQVGILEVRDNSSDRRGAEPESLKSEELLHGLLESTSIQEKLYSAEKCMVPQGFMQELANEREVVLGSMGLKEVEGLK